jgi:hypothetical protein
MKNVDKKVWGKMTNGLKNKIRKRVWDRVKLQVWTRVDEKIWNRIYDQLTFYFSNKKNY